MIQEPGNTRSTENFIDKNRSINSVRGPSLVSYATETSEEETETSNTREISLFEKIQSYLGMEQGSFSSSLFNFCILVLGTGCFALPQKAGILSLVLLVVVIIVAGLSNLLSFFVLAEMSEKYKKVKTYSGMARHLYGKLMGYFLDLVLITDNLAAILIFQVVIYKLLGEVVNDLGHFGHEDVDSFIKKSFWGKVWVIFAVNYGIMLIFLFPISLLKSIGNMRFTSLIGAMSSFILMLIIIIESPFFIEKYYKYTYKEHDETTHPNFFNITAGSKIDMIKSIAAIFFAFACQTGIFPLMDSMNNNSLKEKKCLFKFGISIMIYCYILISVLGYLTQPMGTPDMIFERKKLSDDNNDIPMTIGRIFLICSLVAKIPVLYNTIRIIIFEHLGYYNQKHFPKCFNIILTIVTLGLLTLICSLYQSIADYISLAGGFTTPIMCFLVPGLLYFKGSEQGCSLKNVTIMVMFSVLTLVGFASGVLTIYTIVIGEKKKDEFFY